jgi:hypothetical protein
VAPPTPSVEAEPAPEPDPLADEPPVPSVVDDEPEPAVEPPAPIVDEDDCACANAIPAATIVEANAAVRISLSDIFESSSGFLSLELQTPRKERYAFDATTQRRVVCDVPANDSKKPTNRW